MCRILIFADIRPMGYKPSCYGSKYVFGLLFKSNLGCCVDLAWCQFGWLYQRQIKKDIP